MNRVAADRSGALLSKTGTQFGNFDDATREFVVTDPRTPYPWINYLGNRRFFSIVSHLGGGYSFYKDAKLRRLTRFRANSVPLDQLGKYLYIVDEGDVWSPTWQPVRAALDGFECRHGLGYTRWRSSRNDVGAELLTFVPVNEDLEVQRLTLSNNSATTKRLRLFSYVEWCLWNAEEDQTNFQRTLSLGETRVEGSVAYHLTGYRERRSHYAFHACSVPVTGFDSDRDAFVGPYNGLDRPAAVSGGASLQSGRTGWNPIASFSCDVHLAPGANEELTFLTGYAENPADAKWTADGSVDTGLADAAVARSMSADFVESAFSELAEFWSGKLAGYQAATPEAECDRLVNVWNPYQCMTTFNLARSASYFESGLGRGIGFRDSNQDVLGVVHTVPGRVRSRLLDLAATQHSDGSVFHQYQPLTKSGNHDIGGGFNDDPLWLILSTAAYVKETGDDRILTNPAPFDHGDDESVVLFDHLTASLDFTIANLGPHGLPLIGRADWNDCLNFNAHSDDPDESFQTAPIRSEGTAESVMIAALFVLCAREYIALARYFGRDEHVDRISAAAHAIERAVCQHAWDGEWYLRAFDSDGNPVGSRQNSQANIFVEPQGLCAMARIGEENAYPLRALDAVKEHLAFEYGICLLAPPYSRYDNRVGEIGTYPPGYKENGSVFCHNNPWVIIAEALHGRGDSAMNYYRSIAPTYVRDQALRRTEPYVFAQTVAGAAADRPGEAKNSWLTGTAAWTYVALSQYILGIRPQYDGLLIDPCIPSNWPGFSVTRNFRHARYEISVENPERVCQGVKSVVLNGSVLDTALLPIAAENSVNTVQVVLGPVDSK